MTDSPGSPATPSSLLILDESVPQNPAMNDLPSHKIKKYDRQLRLWGDHGQAALERARICLVNATATGTEVLKNLVLPGTGSFCIADPEIVKASDLGTNFFVTAQSLGSPRAEVTTRLLLEMNTDVKGDYVVETLDSLLEHRRTWFLSFSIVVIADVASEKLLLQLAEILYPAGIPLVICRTYGLAGYIRVVCKEHLVVEAKPDNSLDDLRLDCPFPELCVLVDEIDLDTLTKQQHSHIPWVVVMLKLMDKWKAQGRAFPAYFKEKKAFQEFVEESKWRNEEGVSLDEENFDEARRSVVKYIGTVKIPREIHELFNDPACENLNSSSGKFWIILRAIRNFVHAEGDGHLPLSGALPDMTADTASFVRLQTLYRSKSDADVQLVQNHVSHLCCHLGLPKDHIKVAEVKYYCRNAASLRCFRTGPLSDEYRDFAGLANRLQGYATDDPIFRCSVWYVMLRAVNSFFAETARLPGSDDKDLEADVYQLKAHAQKFLKYANASQEFYGLLTDEVLASYCQEATKYGGEQVHSVASFIGGCVGHEVIKLLTGQYLPLNNTLIFDGTSGITASFAL